MLEYQWTPPPPPRGLLLFLKPFGGDPWGLTLSGLGTLVHEEEWLLGTMVMSNSSPTTAMVQIRGAAILGVEVQSGDGKERVLPSESGV